MACSLADRSAVACCWCSTLMTIRGSFRSSYTAPSPPAPINLPVLRGPGLAGAFSGPLS